MRLDLIDEFRLDLHPYVAGECYPLFDDVASSYPLDLVSTSEFRRALSRQRSRLSLDPRRQVRILCGRGPSE